MTPTPVLTVTAVVTAGESKVSTAAAVVSVVSSAASVPPQALKTRANATNMMIPCLRNDFINPPYNY